MHTINVGVIGVGWCGGIRAVAAAKSPLVAELHLAEIKPERLAEVRAETEPVTATSDWQDLVGNPDIEALLVTSTPEEQRFPIVKAALEAGKHVLVEKPLAITLDEADELIALAEAKGLKLTVGYSQRFNAKQALAKRSVNDGTLGDPVSVLVSRHVSRSIGHKVGSRTKLSQAAMGATHDVDFALWCLEPRRPARVYSQVAWGARRAVYGVPDIQYLVVTMDDGVVVTIGAGASLPPSYPNYNTHWIEFIGTEGALLMDASYKDIILNTMDRGVQFPLSTMPGEYVDHVYAGPMERETLHFLEAVAYDRPVMVDPHLARTTIEVCVAADLSVERNQAVELPLDVGVDALAAPATVAV